MKTITQQMTRAITGGVGLTGNVSGTGSLDLGLGSATVTGNIGVPSKSGKSMSPMAKSTGGKTPRR